MNTIDEDCTCPEEPGFTTMGCPVHDVARPEEPSTDDALERAGSRLDEEIAAVRGTLASTTPTGICMQSARELAVRLRGVERAVRTLKTLLHARSEQVARARLLLRQTDTVLGEDPGHGNKESP